MNDCKDIVIERIIRAHECKSFSCGTESLDNYLKHYARQNDLSGIGRTYVARKDRRKDVLGYYTIASSSVEGKFLPEKYAKKIPGYPVPCALLGRLAVDRGCQGTGLGEHLLMDALSRILHVSDQIGLFAVIVEAINERAKSYYIKYGFEPFKDDEKHLVMSLRTIRSAF
ncbi:MAG TPA: GNAT family N-acetyltransferase [Spirochaetota bacterium]|mgnify:FL=1|nr:GNAT family N-acetyltransferase [Spirochaetota bacterium]HQP48350.1 GNAT family N-acetyltransferase [Spirochaetota bacterium]